MIGLLNSGTRILGGLLRTFSGHVNWVWSAAFDSNDILASGSEDGIIWGK